MGLVLALWIYTSSVKPIPTMNKVQSTLTEQIQEALSNYNNGESPESKMKGIFQIRALADMHPDNADLQWHMGLFSMQSGQYEKAVARFEKVISLDAQRVDAYMQMALSFAALQDTSSAQNVLSTLIEKSEGDLQQRAEVMLEKLK